MHHLSCLIFIFIRVKKKYIQRSPNIFYILFWSEMRNLHLIFIDGFHQLPPRIKVRALFKTRVPFLDGLGDIWHLLGLKSRESFGFWHRWWSFISSAALLRTAGETHWAPDAPVAPPHTATGLMRVQPNYLLLHRKTRSLVALSKQKSLFDFKGEGSHHYNLWEFRWFVRVV